MVDVTMVKQLVAMEALMKASDAADALQGTMRQFQKMLADGGDVLDVQLHEVRRLVEELGGATSTLLQPWLQHIASVVDDTQVAVKTLEVRSRVKEKWPRRGDEIPF